MIRLAIPLTILLLQQTENPVPCGREDDKARPEELAACRCYEERDPCESGETKSCASYCRKDGCGCCAP